jgi:hypothetical protein
MVRTLFDLERHSRRCGTVHGLGGRPLEVDAATTEGGRSVPEDQSTGRSF